jgi:hypothetical protein
MNETARADGDDGRPAGEGQPDDATPGRGLLATDAVLVRQHLVDGAREHVRQLVADHRPDEPGGTDWLLPGEDVATVSLFLGAEEPALLWYVEVTDDPWDAPAAELVARSPLFDAGLGEHVRGAATAVDAREEVVHAVNPSRPGVPENPDVVLVRLGVKPGPGTWLARGLAGAVDAMEGTWLHRRAERSSQAILEEERMWTETLWLERQGGAYTVRWYMEAEDMAHVQDAYDESERRVARWSEAVLDRLFEQPVATLSDPGTASEWELLAHATAPDRR